MSFYKILDQQLDAWHLLKHPLYQLWNEGKLSIETLQLYAKEYYPHVYRFPQYLSAIHSLCPDKMGIKSRQILLGNLIEEELGEDNHPELWLRFAEGLGLSREVIHKQASLTTSQELADGYSKLTQGDYASGLGAIYAYESQTSAVSKTKIDGLKKYYGFDVLNDTVKAESLQFFEVHIQADKWHTEEIAELINQLEPEEQQRVAQGAETGAKLLWSFLSGIMTTMPATPYELTH